MDHIIAIREQLAKLELDAMLVTSRYNRIYASGLPFSFGAVVVTGKGAWYFTDGRFAETLRRAFGEAHTRIVTAQTLYTEIGAVLQMEGVKKLGVEEEYLTYSELHRLQKSASVTLCPAQSLLISLRAVKTAEDIRGIQEAQEMTEAAYEHVLTLIKPGVRERDIAAELVSYMIRLGASGVSFHPIIAAGKRGSLPHGAPTDYRIRPGDFVTMDFGFVVNGWCSDMTRTVAVGSVTEEMRLIYNTVLNAQEAGIAAARAGVMGKEIDAAGRKVITDAGFGEYFCHGFGHGMGMEGHESPGASPTDTTPLPVGAVISAEPGIYIPGRMGVRIEDIIYITETGAVNMNRAPKTLMIL